MLVWRLMGRPIVLLTSLSDSAILCLDPYANTSKSPARVCMEMLLSQGSIVFHELHVCCIGCSVVPIPSCDGNNREAEQPLESANFVFAYTALLLPSSVEMREASSCTRRRSCLETANTSVRPDERTWGGSCLSFVSSLSQYRNGLQSSFSDHELNFKIRGSSKQETTSAMTEEAERRRS